MRQQQKSTSFCRNCFYPIEAQNKFCAQCGQKNTDGRVTIRSFFNEFVSSIFNLDSKIFRTIRDLFSPGKLTLEYFLGKHKRYMHPVRLFLVSFFFCLIFGTGTEGFVSGMKDASNETPIEETYKAVYQQGFYQWFYDEVYYPNRTKDACILELDSLECALYERFPESSNYSDSINIKVLNFGKTLVSTKDFTELSSDKLIEKYKIEGKTNQYLFLQGLKRKKDKNALPIFIVKNAVWIIFFMMPFLGVLLRLFSYKKEMYYVEHLVFSLHSHSFALIVIAMLEGLLFFFPILDNPYFGFLFLSIPHLYFFFALKKVYGYSFGANLFVFIILNIAYVILLLIFMIFSMFIGYLLI